MCCSLYKTRIDTWTIKNRKRVEFDHRCIFCKFWKYWMICLLVYSYLSSFSTSFYRLLISNLMGILILRYAVWCFRKIIRQNSLNFVLKIMLEHQIDETLLQCQEFSLISKHHHKYATKRKSLIIFFLFFYHNDTWMIPK